MSEVTAEERAAREIAEYIEEAWLQVSHLTSKGRLAFIEVAAVNKIRSAVAAEGKRCQAEWEQERRDLINEIKEARMYGGTYQP